MKIKFLTCNIPNFGVYLSFYGANFGINEKSSILPTRYAIEFYFIINS